MASWGGIVPRVSSVARHERCNTSSTRRVFLIHLEIPWCIYIIFLLSIYTGYCVFCYTSSWWDVFSNTFTSGCIFFWKFFEWSSPKGTSGVKKIFQKEIHPRVGVLENTSHLWRCITKYAIARYMFKKR